ncbi:hypothetical protein, partial [Streptomyces sp. NPDC059349]|uniref:hypothetical protein n=1 Tax=Streptomyces sp. NPDC059349 TaxID=3346808 RepID=UPI0036AB4BCF
MSPAIARTKPAVPLERQLDALTAAGSRKPGAAFSGPRGHIGGAQGRGRGVRVRALKLTAERWWGGGRG